MRVELQRLKDHGTGGTPGIFKIYLTDSTNGPDHQFVSLELPWLNNKRNVSCIPPLNYVCKLVDSPKFGRVWHVTNVPERGHILIHPFNVVKQSRGCIGLGMNFGCVKSLHGIMKSKKAVDRFMEATKYLTAFNLDIKAPTR